MTRRDISFPDFAVEYLEMHVPDHMQAIADSVPTATKVQLFHQMPIPESLKKIIDDDYRKFKHHKRLLANLWHRYKQIQHIRLILALRAGIEVRGVKCSEVVRPKWAPKPMTPDEYRAEYHNQPIEE